MTKQHVRLCISFGFGLLALACQPNLGVPPGNRVPTADARVLGKDDALQNVTLDYMGAPLKVTLNGGFSKDPDGTIMKYRWLSGKRKPGTGGAAGSGSAGRGGSGAAGRAGGGAAGMTSANDNDGGTAGSGGAGAGGAGAGGSSGGGDVDDLFITQRLVPPGAPPDWPDDVQQPVVELTEGDYVFVLWVEDDRHVQSAPSTLKVTVRTPLDPAVQMCVDTVYMTVAPACKTCLCSIDDTCRMNSSAAVCGQACWAFLQCIGSKCPDFMPGGDTSCLAANCAAQATAMGATMGATAIGPCVRMCPTQCRGM